MQLQRHAAKRPPLKPELRVLGQPPGPMRSLKQSKSLTLTVGDAPAVDESHGTETGIAKHSVATPRPPAAVTPVTEPLARNPSREATLVPETRQQPSSLMGRLPFGLGRLFKRASA